MPNPALSRAVNRAIAEGAPVYENVPAVLDLQDMMIPGQVTARVTRAHNGAGLEIAILDGDAFPRVIDLDTAAVRQLRDRLTVFLDRGV